MRIGISQYEKVISKLENEQHVYLPDCAKNPEILKQVLQDTFGDSYDNVISEIRQELGDVCTKKYYANFLTMLSK